MTTISLRSTVFGIKDQVSCKLGGEVVILSLKNGVYYSLNPVGVRIWNLINEPILVQDVLDAIIREFDVEPGQCEEDVLVILEDMAKEGLIGVEN